jgi:hypothetical protein
MAQVSGFSNTHSLTFCSTDINIIKLKKDVSSMFHLFLFYKLKTNTILKWAMPLLRQSVAGLSQHISRFSPRAVYMRFMVDKVALLEFV